MALLIVPDDNAKRLYPVQGAVGPFMLTGSWQDLPSGHFILTTDTDAIAIWLDITSGVGVQIRVVATFDMNSNEEFTLPIQSPTSSQVGITEHKYSITTSGSQKIVFSVPLADVLKYVKVQIQGTSGQINNAYVTFRK